jgi:hypothetical protein
MFSFWDEKTVGTWGHGDNPINIMKINMLRNNFVPKSWGQIAKFWGHMPELKPGGLIGAHRRPPFGSDG